jgi:DNA-binding protein H-NS
MSDNNVSLEGLSVSDLTALQAKIDQQIKVKQEEARQEVKNKIIALLEESGLTISDLFPSVKGQKVLTSDSKPKVKVKYSDGQNNWTGRGRMPLWVKSFIQAGGDLASLDVLK